MATPTYPSSRYYAAGAKKGANWGTAVALGANDGLLVLGDTGIGKKQTFVPYPAVDQIIPYDGVLSLIDPVELTLPLNLQYSAGRAGSLLAALFGTAGVPANGGANGVYLHTFEWANSVTNFFTYAEERPGHVWEVPSAMPFRAVIGVEGANITLALSLLGNLMKDDSAINLANQMDAITYISRTNFLHFTQGTFQINAQGGGALGANNAIDISGFEITYERNVDRVHVIGSNAVAEPKEGEIPNAMLKVTLPRASNNNVDYLSDFEDMAAQKALLKFTGATIANNIAYSMTFYFPRLMYQAPPDVKMEPILKNELSFSMLEANANPTGMNDVRPYIELVNSANADYLA